MPTLRLAEGKGSDGPAMSEVNLYPRYAESRLLEALADSPVVLIHGPRQCGKTTLARVVGEPRGYLYLSFTAGVVLYNGEMSASFGNGFWAVPLRTLWEIS